MRGYNSYYPRRRNGFKIFLVLIIIVAAVWYANSQGIIHLNLPDFGSLNLAGNQNSAINACEQKVTACGGVFNSKYNSSMTLLNKAYVNNSADANAFLVTWRGSQPGDISSYNVSLYPIVLIAERFDNSDNTKVPYIFICKSDGNLEENSKGQLC